MSNVALWEKRLQEIKPGMKLNKAYFLSVYSDEITWPGSADVVIKALEDAGCSNARKYYNQTVEEYEHRANEELKPVARLVHERWEADWQNLLKEGEAKRRKEKRIQDLLQKSDRELLNLLQTRMQM